MEQSTKAMATWLGTLARAGILSSAHASAIDEAGLAVAAYVVGEERLDELGGWFAVQGPAEATREKRAAIETCIWMANADRKLDPEEVHLLSTMVGACGFDEDTVDELVAEVHDPPSLDGIEERLTHPVLRELMLALCWEMASADGEVAKQEEQFHVGLAKRLGVSAERAAELRADITRRISLPPA